MWLLRKVNPDHKTIADFRKDNRKSFKKVFREFNMLCRKLNLFGNELMAIDGGKFIASNNKDKNITEKLLETKLREIDEKVENYFQEMDELDKEESDKPEMSVDELHEKIFFVPKTYLKNGESTDI